MVSAIFFTVMSAVLGYLMMTFVEQQMPAGLSSGEVILRIAAMLVFLYVALFLHLVIHEAGHLLFGILSRYTFSSFRVGSFMLLKENGKLVSKRLKIAGTGGQCLMAPPDMVDGKFPVVLYNMGGSILNVFVSLLFVPGFMIVPQGGILALFCILMIGMGFVLGLVNGFPLHTKTVDTDGYNALSLRKSREAMRAFWIQMKVNEQLSKGLRLKDMPDEWFEMPSDESMKNNLVAAVGVYACNRLMDQHRFQEADDLMAHILNIESGMVGIHRNLVICDRMYLEMIHQNRLEVVERFHTREQKQFMKAMRTFPSVIRTEYAYAVLIEKDQTKASKVMAAFEKVAKTYPYPSDINSERELMELVDAKASV